MVLSYRFLIIKNYYKKKLNRKAINKLVQLWDVILTDVSFDKQWNVLKGVNLPAGNSLLPNEESKGRQNPRSPRGAFVGEPSHPVSTQRRPPKE